MKHAGPATLDALEEVLVALRARAELKEKKRGIFYRKPTAFLHFHEDKAGLFADLKGFDRLPVNAPEERKALPACVASALEPVTTVTQKRG